MSFMDMPTHLINADVPLAIDYVSGDREILNSLECRNGVMTSTKKSLKSTKWICDICNKSLCSKRSFNDHMNIHKNVRPFTCPECKYSSASKNTLHRHILRQHETKDKWSYLCPYCPEMFVEAAGYKSHLKQRHDGCSGTFGCPFEKCIFSTMSAIFFKLHIVRHNPLNAEYDSTISTDISQSSLILFLIKDTYGPNLINNLSLLDNSNKQMVDNNYLYKIKTFEEEDEGEMLFSKYGITTPKFRITRNTLSGKTSYTQSIPLPKSILDKVQNEIKNLGNTNLTILVNKSKQKYIKPTNYMKDINIKQSNTNFINFNQASCSTCSMESDNMETYNEGQQILADEFEEVDDNCVVCEEDSNVYDYHFSSDENEEFDEYEEQIMDEQVANIMPITSNRFQTVSGFIDEAIDGYEQCTIPNTEINQKDTISIEEAYYDFELD